MVRPCFRTGFYNEYMPPFLKISLKIVPYLLVCGSRFNKYSNYTYSFPSQLHIFTVKLKTIYMKKLLLGMQKIVCWSMVKFAACIQAAVPCRHVA
jgi:hypothetical protein